jgi:hypothetical protein
VGWTLIAADAVEAASTTTVLNLTAHVARVGDAIFSQTGTAANQKAWAIVKTVAANTVTLTTPLPATPTAADQVLIMRPVLIAASGAPSGQSGTALMVNVDAGYQNSGGQGLLKLEDAAAASGDALVGIAAIVNSSLVNKAADTDYVGLAATEQGALQVSLDVNATSSSVRSPVRAEDGAIADTQAVMMAGAVNNRLRTQYNTTNGDALPIGAGDMGNVLASPIYDANLNTGVQTIRIEDDAFSNGDAMTMAGFQMETALTANAGTTGDVSQAKVDAVGRQITTMAPAGESFTNCSGSATGVVDVAIKAAVASNRSYVTSITCSNTAAAVSTEVEIRDGTTVMDVGYVASTTLGVSQWTKTYPVPLRGSVNTAVNVRPVTTSSATRCCAQGYISVN